MFAHYSIPLQVDIISKIEDVVKLVTSYVKNTDIGMAEVRRACKYISKSFYALTGDETQTKFSKLADKDAIVQCLCQEVGPNNMEPLIAFIELLSVDNEDTSLASACIKSLKIHQEAIQRLSPCFECTSPPTTPTRPPVLFGSKTFYLLGSFNKISASPSPPSGNSPVACLNILPSDILKFSAEIQSHFDAEPDC